MVVILDQLFLICLVLGFTLEYLDSSLGGGFGTILTPLFMLMGWSPLEIIPIILISETITGFLAGFLHNSFGNIDKKAFLILTLFAIFGSFLGITVAISIPGRVLKTYIGLLILGIGLLTVRKYIRRTKAGGFSLWKTIGIGSICGFNKVMSGGGFGPVATSGLALSDLDPKKSIGSTTLAEGAVCLFGVLTYGAIFKSVNWNIAIPLIAGAILAAFPASYTTYKLHSKKVGIFVGGLATLLGIVTLLKVML